MLLVYGHVIRESHQRGSHEVVSVTDHYQRCAHKTTHAYV